MFILIVCHVVTDTYLQVPDALLSVIRHNLLIPEIIPV
jgi:hypothetical protein